jgi:hypothetical protein
MGFRLMLAIGRAGNIRIPACFVRHLAEQFLRWQDASARTMEACAPDENNLLCRGRSQC